MEKTQGTIHDGETAPVESVVIRPMFDLPKACHFTITQDGEPLRPDSQFGLNIRWGLANTCRDAGITDMLRLSLSERVTIGKICERENRRMEKIGVVVQLKLQAAEAV